MLYIVNLNFGSSGRHEDSPLYLEAVATICDSLRMVSRTRSYNSSFALLLSQAAERSSCSPDLEATNHLKILTLQVDIGTIFGGEKGRALERGGRDNLLIFAVGLIDFGGRDKLRRMVTHKI